MGVRQKVEDLLRSQFPGIEFHWDEDPLLTRLTGTIAWSGFSGMTQLERQRQLGLLLRTHLGARATEVGIIFALTPDERAAILDAA